MMVDFDRIYNRDKRKEPKEVFRGSLVISGFNQGTEIYNASPLNSKIIT